MKLEKIITFGTTTTKVVAGIGVSLLCAAMSAKAEGKAMEIVGEFVDNKANRVYETTKGFGNTIQKITKKVKR